VTSGRSDSDIASRARRATFSTSCGETDIGCILVEGREN